MAGKDVAINNFTLVQCDTDGISFCKPDHDKFTEEETTRLVEQLNSLTEELIIWEYEEVAKVVVVVKTKNYALYDGSKVTIKGSALKATQKEPALREMLHRMIRALLEITTENLQDIYLEYVKEAYKIKDIKRWGAKKSVTDSVLNPSRTNERKVNDAIQGKGYQLGEKFFVYFRSDESLACVEDFDSDYHVDKMLEKVYKTVDILKTVVDVKDLFPNYKLKKNKVALEKLVNPPIVRKGVIKL